MSTITVIRALKKWWWAALALMIAGGLAGLLVTFLMTPVWKSTAQLAIVYDAPEGAGSSELVQANNFAVQKVFAYQQIALSPRVLQGVIDSLDLDTTYEELIYDVEVEVPLNTPIISLSGLADTPEDAATLAGAFRDSLIDVIDHLEAPSDGGPAPVRVESLQEPQPPIDPAQPVLLVNLAIGLASGFVVGLIWLAVAAATDRRVHNAESLSHLPYRVLGSIPNGSKSAEELSQHPLSPMSEAYRTVSATLGHLPGAGARVVAVAPATPRDHASTLTANLALAFAEFGARVVLVDANLRSGTITSSLGLQGPGLKEVLLGEVAVDAALQSVHGISVLPAGEVEANPAELMSGSALGQTVRHLKSDFDLVLMDAAPAVPLSDTIFAASAADSTVLAVSAGSIRTEEVTTAAETLLAVGVTVAGVVVLHAPTGGVDADPSVALYRDLKPASP